MTHKKITPFLLFKLLFLTLVYISTTIECLLAIQHDPGDEIIEPA